MGIIKRYLVKLKDIMEFFTYNSIEKTPLILIK